jgi:8-oxo-dGTP diphosphatase
MDRKFVVGILIKNGKYLAEVRRESEHHNPGKIVFPGGGIEANEKPEEALAREMKEEMGVIIDEYHFIGEFYYADGASLKAYAITNWKGIPKPLEAKNLVWIEKEDQLPNEFDKVLFRKLKEAAF